ncbi:transposase [Schinkia azotoformans]|uniref:transposase n=1 Tax=Schinkia azotoformans TaxID=1454 RepID=UPI002DB63309|nr:transposase [Schinkia azotoformans]MEC1718796.1 transposase [Schinkia azotoformans]MED4351031.1 transposase [Schinkia azotoformans]MED4412992.1 transposase [Schinkia azotoformans]
MAKKPRTKSNTGTYHVMLRGINKQIIFEGDADKRKFIEVLKKIKEISNFQLFSYCLMDNHVHLLLKETEEGISDIVKRISASYALWFNFKYQRCGSLFQGRFRSENVETNDYFMRVIRYIHQNPLKAGIASNVFENKWTSIHEFFSTGDMIDTETVLKQFSKEKTDTVQKFKDFMEETNEDEFLDDFDIVKKTDSEVINILNQMGIENIAMIQQMDKKERNDVLLVLKKMEGITVRQLSRITGISRSVIARIQ